MIIFIMDSSADYFPDQFMYCVVCKCRKTVRNELPRAKSDVFMMSCFRPTV